jgi:hypothetical protein
MRASASRWPLVVALLMGGAVGPYTYLSSPQPLDVVLTIAALALPMLFSVALDPAIASRPAALAKVGVPILIIAAVLLANAMNPAIWQSYASTAVLFSLLPAMVLAPLCAGFVSGAGVDPAAPFAHAARKSLAWRCGALAWLGVGIHNLVIPYVIPLIGLVAFLVTRTPATPVHGGLFGVFILASLVITLFILFVIGFGLAIPTGLGGEALHARLRRVPVAVAP